MKKAVKKNDESGGRSDRMVAVTGLITALAALISAVAALIMAMK